ncbi:MAG: PIG-L family deacetylase [Myxococcota bacterium]
MDADLAAWAGRRVVGVFPHPDDEAWAAGGLLARAAAAGAEVHLVSVTAGEAGTNRGGADGPIAVVRAAELRAAAAALGAAAVHVLGLPDGGLATASFDAVAACLERLGPAVVVALGDDGGYGHADHVALTRALRALVPASTPLWLAAFPPGLFEPVRAGLARRRPELCADVRLGVAQPTFELALTADERRRKLLAIRAHRSQLPGGDALRFLGPGVVARLIEREGWVVR